MSPIFNVFALIKKITIYYKQQNNNISITSLLKPSFLNQSWLWWWNYQFIRNCNEWWWHVKSSCVWWWIHFADSISWLMWSPCKLNTQPHTQSLLSRQKSGQDKRSSFIWIIQYKIDCLTVWGELNMLALLIIWMRLVFNESKLRVFCFSYFSIKNSQRSFDKKETFFFYIISLVIIKV